MKIAHPYLYFDGNTEEAFNFYKSVFGVEFISVSRFKDFGDNSMDLSDEELNKIAHIGLHLGSGVYLMGNDSVSSMKKNIIMGNNFYITIDPESSDEADKLFEGLSNGGEIEMPLQKTEWAEKYGSLIDKFGVQWMINFEG